jgi:hypothetical protein
MEMMCRMPMNSVRPGRQRDLQMTVCSTWKYEESKEIQKR